MRLNEKPLVLHVIPVILLREEKKESKKRKKVPLNFIVRDTDLKANSRETLFHKLNVHYLTNQRKINIIYRFVFQKNHLDIHQNKCKATNFDSLVKTINFDGFF